MAGCLTESIALIPRYSRCLVLLDIDLLSQVVGQKASNHKKGIEGLRENSYLYGVDRIDWAAVPVGGGGFAGKVCVVALAAGGNLEELRRQIERHHPEIVSVGDAKRADELARMLREKGISPIPEIHHGREGMLTAGTHPKADIVVSAAVGVVGLEATYEAVNLGKTVALSNKECSSRRASW